jgi:YebC/PmpR family DNA-binding regulatory protein
MPKDKVEAAIKRASGQGAAVYEEILYEGYAPYGVAVLVETATDNPTRTVANVRSLFNHGGGSLGSTGSVVFNFKHMGVFRLNPEQLDAESLELEEMGESTGDKEEPQLVIRCSFQDFGHMQRALEERGITPVSAELEYVALNPVHLPEDQATKALAVVDQLEQDDDVQKVFHNLA